MKKFFCAINQKLSFTKLFGLLKLYFLFIYIKCEDDYENTLNNIIIFEEDFRYLSFANNSNGDMIFLLTAYPHNEKRIFYGIKKNGRPFFQNETSYFYSMNSTKEIGEKKFESDTLVIKLSDKSEKEYLISTGTQYSYAEIYDFENNKVNKKKIDSFANNYNVYSLRNMGIFLSSNISGYYYLFGFTIYDSDNSNYKFSLQIHKFNEVENFNTYNTFQREIKIDNSYNEKDGISCFITKKQIIMCFYLKKKNNGNGKSYYYNIIAYDIDLKEKKENSFTGYIYNNPFYRGIHLKDEIGVFAYYQEYYGNKLYPILLLKQFSNKIDNYSISEINLAYYYQLDTSLLKNDLIKLREDKICFSSIKSDETIIYIFLIYLFNDDKSYKVMPYFFFMNEKYKFKTFSDIKIRTHNYNNFISFALSYCDNFENKYFAGLMIFSYPNSIDNSSDLYKFLINNYNSTINDFNVNLRNEVKIVNNLFEYEFNSILIQNISNCTNPKLISYPSNTIIGINSSLSEDDLIKLKFNERNYSSFNCNIEYIPVLIEPDLKLYDENSIDKKLRREKYYGRLTYYSIYLNESLNDNCTDHNCNLCLDNNKSFCINCKYNFTVEPSTKEKICIENIDSKTFYFNNGTYETNLTDEYKTDKKDSDTMKTEYKIDMSIEKFNTEERKGETDIDTNSLDRAINKSESINTIEEGTTQITQIYSDIDTETLKIINNITENKITNIITEEKKTEDINKDFYEEKLDIDKNELIENISKIIESIKIGKNYEYTGEDFILSIKPTKSFSKSNSTHVDFSTCEKIIRNAYHIDEPRIITFLQLEIMNKNDKSLVNQVEYQAYDDNKTLLNLSLCSNEDIQVYYLIKQNSTFDLSSLSLFNELDIDLLNIKDKFFTDICFPFSDNDNDIVLSDRIIDFYQNYSLCEDGYTYNEVNIQLMIISCNCSVKTNISTAESTAKLEQLGDIEKSLAFEIIKCYNLFFSWKDKMKNFGFWIYFIFVIIHIPLLFLLFYKGFNKIKEYIYNEMENNGYISKIDDSSQTNKKVEIQKKQQKINSSKTEQNIDSPPKKEKNISIKKTKSKNKKNKIKNKYSFLNNNSSTSKMPQSENEIMDEINKKEEKYTNIIDNKNINLGKSKTQNFKNKKNKKNKNLSYMPTQIIPSSLKDNPIVKKLTIKKDNNILNLCLINYNINLHQDNKYDFNGTNYIINIYSFEEAIKDDYRPLCKIFYIYLLAKQAFFHAFLYRSPLVLFPLRLSLLIFIISSDFGLNAIFYFDDKISEKYREAKNIFVFALSKNITVILISTLIGFIFLTLFMKLSNSTNDIRNIFQNEEKLLKKNKKYIVTEKRKREIFEEILTILKKYKIKVVILMSIEILLLLFFWYYVTIFCHVYSKTQKSWIVDSLLTMLSRLIIDLLLCLFYAKLYRISIESNFNSIYKIALFFYCFC